MTTTPNPTAEQIVAGRLAELRHLPESRWEENDARFVVNALRAHGLLSEGAPSEEQCGCTSAGDCCEATVEGFMCTRVAGHRGLHVACSEETHDLTGALTAAGVAQQGAIGVGETAELPTEGRESWNVAPQEPGVCNDDGCLHYDHPSASSPDREKLIAEAEGIGCPDDESGCECAGGLIRRLADALAAQPVLDESKVAAKLKEWGSEPEPMRSDIAGYRARALCEAEKRGELNAD